MDLAANTTRARLEHYATHGLLKELEHCELLTAMYKLMSDSKAEEAEKDGEEDGKEE